MHLGETAPILFDPDCMDAVLGNLRPRLWGIGHTRGRVCEFVARTEAPSGVSRTLGLGSRMLHTLLEDVRQQRIAETIDGLPVVDKLSLAATAYGPTSEITTRTGTSIL